MANQDQLIIEIVMEDGKVVKTISKIKKETEQLSGDIAKSFESANDDIIKSFEDAFGGNRITAFASKLGGLTPVIAGVAGGVAAIGLALERTLEGEKINAITKQFEILSQQAGASSLALKAGLEEAAAGLVDTEDILKSTNKFLVEFGNNANRIPEVFDLARKATALFGGEVTQNFEALSQAILTGQTRGLKNFGIIIDQKKAYDDYAKSIGTTAEYLSETGKRQAILNAALEKGQTTFGNVQTEVTATANSITRLKVSINELFDFLATKTASGLSTPFQAAFDAIDDGVKAVTTSIKAHFGTGIDQMEAEAARLKGMIAEVRKGAEGQTDIAKFLFGELKTDKLDAQLKVVEDKIATFYQEQAKAQARAANGLSTAASDQANIDLEARKKASEKALEMLANENIKANEIRINSATDYADRAQAIHDQEMAITAQFEAEKAVLKKQYLDSGVMTQDQYNQLIIDKEIEKNDKLRQLQEKSMVTAQQINKAFNSALGAGIANGVAQFTKSLLAGENAFSAFGKALFGMIADIAVQMGTFFIMQGTAQLLLFSNPATAGAGMVAWGAGLVAFGTLLKALAGGQGATGGAGAGGGGGADTGGGIAMGATSVTEAPVLEQAAKPKTEVMVNIEGNVLDRRESGLAIVDVLNEYFDTNDGVLART